MAQDEKKEAQNITMKDAQFRKGLSIAYFNALNNAIQLVTMSGMRFGTTEEMMTQIETYKMMFLEQHGEYYGRMIAPIGANYDPKNTIKRLQATITKPELTMVWLSLSEDERQNKEIRDVAYALRAKYASAQIGGSSAIVPKVEKPAKALKAKKTPPNENA